MMTEQEEKKPKFEPIQPEISPTAVPLSQFKKPSILLNQKSDRDKMLEAVAIFGGSFDFLADEPDLYTENDGISLENPVVNLDDEIIIHEGDR